MQASITPCRGNDPATPVSHPVAGATAVRVARPTTLNTMRPSPVPDASTVSRPVHQKWVKRNRHCSSALRKTPSVDNWDGARASEYDFPVGLDRHRAQFVTAGKEIDYETSVAATRADAVRARAVKTGIKAAVGIEPRRAKRTCAAADAFPCQYDAPRSINRNRVGPIIGRANQET